jgi:hypothetical protein
LPEDKLARAEKTISSAFSHATLYVVEPPQDPDMKNPLSGIAKRITPVNRPKIEKVAKVAAGTAAAIWVVLKLKRELYGPGGTRMSRYDRAVDEIWKRD